MRALIILCLVVFCSCGPNSLEDFHYEGQELAKKMIQDLKPIETREDLQKKLPVLKKRFNALVDLMIEARKYKEHHPDEEEVADLGMFEDALLDEMKRVYTIEKGKELIEGAQRESLLRLDAFNRTLNRKRGKI